MLLDFAGTIVIGAGMATVLVTVLTAIPLQSATRIRIATLAGAWVAFAIAGSAAGWLTRVATLPAIFSVPFIALIVLSAGVPSFRTALAQLPLSVIVRLNAWRVLGGFFLLLALVGRLGGPFPYFAGIGDVITGIVALLMWRAVSDESIDPGRILAWNAFGMLDLIVAVFLGVTSQPNSATQLFHVGVGSAAILTLPWSLVPLVLVPIYLIGHVLVFARLRFGAAPRQGYASSMT